MPVFVIVSGNHEFILTLWIPASSGYEGFNHQFNFSVLLSVTVRLAKRFSHLNQFLAYLPWPSNLFHFPGLTRLNVLRCSPFFIELLDAFGDCFYLNSEDPSLSNVSLCVPYHYNFIIRLKCSCNPTLTLHVIFLGQLFSRKEWASLGTNVIAWYDKMTTMTNVATLFW